MLISSHVIHLTNTCMVDTHESHLDVVFITAVPWLAVFAYWYCAYSCWQVKLPIRTELCYSDITINGSGVFFNAVDIWHDSTTFWFALCINKLLLVMPQLCNRF